MKPIHALLFCLLIPLLAFVSTGNNTGIVGMSMESKTLENGVYTKVKAEIYYQSNTGKMLTHFKYPHELVTIANSTGELSVYDPKSNSVSIKQSNLYSTKENWLYFFLSGSTNDMGLELRGFNLKDTRFEDDLMITEWLPPANLAGQIKRIELVHREFQPLYLGYEKTGGGHIRKVYFKNYHQLEDRLLPQSITEILYFDDRDSVITSTRFDAVKMNTEIPLKYANFTVPKDAKRLE